VGVPGLDAGEGSGEDPPNTDNFGVVRAGLGLNPGLIFCDGFFDRVSMSVRLSFLFVLVEGQKWREMWPGRRSRSREGTPAFLKAKQKLFQNAPFDFDGGAFGRSPAVA
jgi:hypothetical protein